MRGLKAMIIATGLLAGGPALADCNYLGNSYPVGYVICSEGWLQECTIAGYWSAIGMCHAPDTELPRLELSAVVSQPASSEVAMALETPECASLQQ